MNTNLILQGWRSLEPSPQFAERVLAACDASTVRDQQPVGRSWLIGAGALAVAALLLPLLLGDGSNRHESLAAVQANVDFGTQPD